jgi:hypothetical protein
MPFKKVPAIHSLTSASKSPSKRKRSETDDDLFQNSPTKRHSPAIKGRRRLSLPTLNEKLQKLKGKTTSSTKLFHHTLSPTSSAKKQTPTTPRTPVTPRTAEDFRITPSRGKTLTNYGSKLRTLILSLKHLAAQTLREGRVPADDELGEWMSDSFTALALRPFKALLIEYYEKEPLKRSFSSLNSGDLKNIMDQGMIKQKGLIEFNQKKLTEGIQIPESFFYQMNLYMRTTVRTVKGLLSSTY